MYCAKCGNQLRAESIFCSRCGTPVAGANRKQYGTKIAEAELTIAKVFCLLLMSGAVGACGIAAIGLFAVACYMFYCFATGGAAIFPWLFAGSLAGVPLVFGGIMSAFIAILFAMAVFAMIRGMRGLVQKSSVE